MNAIMPFVDRRPRPNERVPLPTSAEINKLAGLRKEAENKLKHLVPVTRSIAFQGNCVVLVRWLLSMLLAAILVYVLYRLHTTDISITEREIASRLPNRIGDVDMLTMKVANMTYRQYANVTAVAMKLLLDYNQSEAGNIKEVCIMSLWSSVFTGLSILTLYYVEFSLFQKLKRYRKKVTECETILEMKGKRSDMIDRLLKFLGEDHVSTTDMEGVLSM